MANQNHTHLVTFISRNTNVILKKVYWENYMTFTSKKINLIFWAESLVWRIPSFCTCPRSSKLSFLLCQHGVKYTECNKNFGNKASFSRGFIFPTSMHLQRESGANSLLTPSVCKTRKIRLCSEGQDLPCNAKAAENFGISKYITKANRIF